MSGPVLDIAGLHIAYGGAAAVRGVDLHVGPGEIVGIVGESGSGKSSVALAIPGLLPPAATMTAQMLALCGNSPIGAAQRGPDVAMIFQEPASSFSPYLAVSRQLEAFMWREKTLPRAVKRAKIASLLTRLGIAEAERRMALYPHQFSGGMLQRIAIAAALLMRPALVIADEPTTALDVTTEAQIMHLLRGMRDEAGSAILLITHHVGVVAQLCDRVLVMYAGKIVEQGSVDAVLTRPAHPYTQALLACEPGLVVPGQTRLSVIPGHVPRETLPGCGFAPRCQHCAPVCNTAPALHPIGAAQASRCHLAAA